MKKLLVFVFCGVMAINCLYAITSMELKEARLKVYDWVRDYQVYMQLIEYKNPDGKFKKLFESSDMLIFNDYYPQNDYNFDNPYINIDAYVDSILNYKYSRSFSIDSVYIKSEKVIGNDIEYKIRFNKTVKYSFRINYLHQYKITNKCEVILHYNTTQKTIKSHSLRLSPDFKRIDPFFIYTLNLDNPIGQDIHANKDVENTLNLDKPIDHEIYSQKDVEDKCNRRSKGIITYTYERILINDKLIDPRFIKICTDTLKNSVGIYGFSGVGQYHFHNDAFYNVKKINYDAGLGLNYYRQLYLHRNNRFGINVGLQYVWSKYNISADYYDEYDATDPDGANYLRKIRASIHRENINSYALSIPLKLRYDYFINNDYFFNNMSIFSNIGIVVQCDMYQKSNLKGEVVYSGYYDNLYKVEIDQNGIYDFGHYSLKNNSLKHKTLNFNINVLAEIGWCYYIKPHLSFDLSLIYNAKVFNLKKTQEFHLTRYDGDLNSSYNAFNKLKSHSLNINVQLNYNF